MKHEYTVEVLYHFTCSRCQMWWSWASTPTTSIKKYPLPLPEDELVFCPHCGKKDELKVKDKFLS